MEEHCEECHLGTRTFERCEMCEKLWKECKCLCRKHGEGCVEIEYIDEWVRENTESFGIKGNEEEENLECKICGNKEHDEENCAEKEGERFQDRRKTDYWKENDEEEKDDTDESEKIGEILSPGKYEDWDENIEK
ncbi:hypothetical protein C1645_744319 [Glomus cerebriforme]|uniref:Uncharacterized protein n=1 Tax=Glomus cerebriforme TaxID=658196 RepID=A0A397SCG1_9GLOM|nr:hypothetical protein C1645_744319 [Glomus cerebriforme]